MGNMIDSTQDDALEAASDSSTCSDLGQQLPFLLLNGIRYFSQNGLVTINGSKILEKTWRGLPLKAKSRRAERFVGRSLQESCNEQLRRFELSSTACSQKL